MHILDVLREEAMVLVRDLAERFEVSESTIRRDLEELEAPGKGFYTFNESAHSPMFEEPRRLKEILIRDVLNRSTSLAEK